MIDAAAAETDPAVREVMYSNIEIDATSDVPMIYVADLFRARIVRTWIEGMKGSGALNPTYTAPFQ